MQIVPVLFAYFPSADPDARVHGLITIPWLPVLENPSHNSTKSTVCASNATISYFSPLFVAKMCTLLLANVIFLFIEGTYTLSQPNKFILKH